MEHTENIFARWSVSHHFTTGCANIFDAIVVFRCLLFIEKCKHSVMIQPVFIHDKLPVINYDSHALAKLPSTRLYLQFKRYPDYFLVSTLYHLRDFCFTKDTLWFGFLLCNKTLLFTVYQVAAVSVDREQSTKPLHDKYYLLQIKQAAQSDGSQQHDNRNSTSDDKSKLLLNSKAENFQQLNVAAILNKRTARTKRNSKSNSNSNDLRKRKVGMKSLHMQLI